jgi:hypothetical protein
VTFAVALVLHGCSYASFGDYDANTVNGVADHLRQPPQRAVGALGKRAAQLATVEPYH